MKKRFSKAEILIIIAALALLLHAFFPFDPRQQLVSNSANEEIAHFEKSNGTYQVRRAGSFAWRSDDQNPRFASGDALRTGPQSHVWLRDKNGRQIEVSPSAMIVFRANQDGKNLDLSFAITADGNREPASASAQESMFHKLSEAQDLWWTSPSSQEVWKETEDNIILISWDSLRPTGYHLIAQTASGVLASTPTQEKSYALKLSPLFQGTIKVQLRTSDKEAIHIERSFTVRRVRSPAWIRIENAWSPPILNLAWDGPSDQSYEVMLQDRLGKSKNQIITGNRLRWPLNQADGLDQDPPLIAFVRRKLSDSNWTSWSEAQVLTPRGAKIDWALRSRQGMALSSSDGSKQPQCSTPFNASLKDPSKGRGSSFEIVSSKAGLDLETQIVVPNAEGQFVFCPRYFGKQQLRLVRRSSDGFILASSDLLAVELQHESPKLQNPGLEYLDSQRALLRLQEGRSLPVEIEWQSSPNEKPQKIIGKQSLLPFDVPNDLQRLRARYITSQGESLSEWSPWQPVNPLFRPESSVPSTGHLALSTEEQGPVYGTDWSSYLWTELGWNSEAKAAYYELETSSVGQFQGEQKKQTLRTNRAVVSYSTKSLLFWRVRAVDTDGRTGDWTEVKASRYQSVRPSDPSVATRSQPDAKHPRRPSAQPSLTNPSDSIDVQPTLR